MMCRFAGALAVSTLLALPALAQSSAHYSVKRSAVVSGAAALSSSNFRNNATGPQYAVSGGSSFCNTGRRNEMGFWSVSGQTLVPIVLTTKKNPSDPLDVDLSWSGTAATYQFFRAYTPTDVLNPGNLEFETNQCSTTDLFAFQSPRVFYSVIPKP
jgi:hypothetical protein